MRRVLILAILAVLLLLFLRERHVRAVRTSGRSEQNRGHAEPAAASTDTTVVEERRQLLWQMGQDLNLSPVAVRDEVRVPGKCVLTVKNLLDEPLELEAAIGTPEGCDWRFDETGGELTVAPGSAGTLTLELENGGPPFPAPTIHVVGRSGGKLVLDQEGPWPVSFDRRLQVQATGFAQRQTTWRALWDDENLYLGFEPGAGKTLRVAAYRNAMAGAREFSCWTVPRSGAFSDPANFREAVLR